MKCKIFDRIKEWNAERGLTKFNPSTEYLMLHEELTELRDAMNNGNNEAIVDALADIVILAVGAMWKLHYNPNIVMDEVLKEIESRTGSVNPQTGKWEKDKKAKIYKAKLSKAKMKVSPFKNWKDLLKEQHKIMKEA